MLPQIILAVIVVLPVILGLALRVHALYLFVGVCVGYMLQMSLAESVDLLVAMFIKGSDSLLIAKLVLFALPVLLIFLFLRKTVGKGAMLQLIPLVSTGIMLSVFLLQLLPPKISQQVMSSEYGGILSTSSDLSIAISSGLNLILMIILFKHSKDHKKH